MSPNPAVLTWPAAVAGGGGDATLTFRGVWASGDNVTGWSQIVDIGPEAPTRTVFVAVHNERADITGVTIGGAAATIDASAGNGQSTNYSRVAIARAVVPVGATATVAVAASAMSLQHAVAVWTFGGPVALVDAESIHLPGGNPTLTISTGSGGFALAAADNGRSIATAWTGIAEEFDILSMGGESGSLAGGSAATAGANLTISPTCSPLPYCPTHVAGAYVPA